MRMNDTENSARKVAMLLDIASEEKGACKMQSEILLSLMNTSLVSVQMEILSINRCAGVSPN